MLRTVSPRNRALFALAGLVALAAASAAEARAGRGGGFGSRGGRTFDAPAQTQTAPNAARPIERSQTTPSQIQRPAPAPTPAPQPPAATKVTYAADAFFDFDKAVLKLEGRAKLDDLVGKVKDINLEVIIAVGHTDSVGGDTYNQKLSVQRAEAVKSYLVSKGIEKNRVYTEGKGEKQPVADNKTTEGRAKNRRVEIEVVGTRNRR